MDFSNAQHAHLNAYVRDIADRLRLRDTAVKVSHQRPAPGYAGQSQNTFGRKALTVWIDAGLALDRVQLRQTVVHEVIHAHFDEMRDVFLDVCDGEPEGDTVPAVFYRVFKRRWEVCLDTMAEIIAGSMPLIDPFPEE